MKVATELLFGLFFCLALVFADVRPVVPYVLTPPPGTFIQTQSTTAETVISVDFNQPVQQGVQGNISIFAFQNSKKILLYSTSTRSFPVRISGATARLTLPVSPLILTTPKSFIGISVDSGAFVASDSGLPCPSIEPDNWMVEVVANAPFDNSEIPKKPTQQSRVPGLYAHVQKERLNRTVVTLSSFYNRFYDEPTGAAAFQWLMQEYNNIVALNAGSDLHPHKALASKVSIQTLKYGWMMPCAVVRIEGSNSALAPIVLGAHLDSINRQNWTVNVRSGRAPGANDDGTGIALQLEFFRVILEQNVSLVRSIEFHIFSAEEEGLYGSRQVSAHYRRNSLPIRAMMQLDQCGYLRDPENPVVAIFQDNTDPLLTGFVTLLADAYCNIPWIYSNEDGRADSDFHSYTNMGYRACYVAEGPVDDIVYGSDKHTPFDIWENVNLDHVLSVGSIAFGFLIELSSN